MDRDKLIELLKRHEGVKQFPYVDTAGKLTIGVGHNLTDNGMTLDSIENMLVDDIEEAEEELHRVYPEWCDLSEDRQIVLVSMMFNMGCPTYLTFNRFWAALRRSDYDEAAEQMLDSKWSRQVGQRSHDLAELMREG